MNEVQFFNFNGSDIRIVELDGEPWFVGRDVCDRLGYVNAADAMSRHCHGVVKRYPILDSLNRIQEVRLLSEPDVMRLICSSQLPEAVAFERWVFEEVLPSVRRHGGYLTPVKIEEALLNPDTLIRLATDLKLEREKRLELERTKAWIADRQTATALATASVVTRKYNRLRDEIGTGKTWKRVTCIPWIGKYFDTALGGVWSVLGKKLSELSAQMEYPIRTVPDEKFGEVKAYHVDVIERFHLLVREDPDNHIMPRFRRLTA